MGLNTYPANPFPPSTDQMDADALEAEVSKLKSGLTNVDVALSVPENTGKNVLPLTLDRLKDLNSSGSWNNNVYTYKSLTCTVETNNEGYITSIKVNGTADSQAVLVLFNGDIGTGSYTLNGITGGSASTYLFYAPSAFGEVYSEKTANVSGSFELDLYVRSGVTLENQMFYPMIRPATITDATFAPYIPSVESRIEAVESGVTNYSADITAGTDVTFFRQKVYKVCNICCVNLVADKTQWAENDVIGTIPTGYRPITDVTTLAVSYNMPSDNVQVSITTSGNIVIFNKGTQAAGRIFLNIMYVCASFG